MGRCCRRHRTSRPSPGPSCCPGSTSRGSPCCSSSSSCCPPWCPSCCSCRPCSPPPCCPCCTSCCPPSPRCPPSRCPPRPCCPSPRCPPRCPSAPEPAYHPEPYHEEKPKDYQFGYDVHGYDEYGNANVHSRTEQRDGYNVKGQYRVELPDCRVQIVDYFVDEYKRYHADVKYEGVPCPDKSLIKHHKDGYHAPPPAYAPAPVPAYAPAPAPSYAPAPVPAYHA